MTEGDNFVAGFTVMNRTDKAQLIDIVLQAKGVIETPEGSATQITTQMIEAEPYKRYKVWLPLKTTDDGEIQLHAMARSATEQDGLETSLTVRKRRALETAATYGTTTQDEVVESVQIPEDIYPDVGDLRVIASPTVIGGLEGAFKYMRDYPYACWEQKLSKGTMASHYLQLQDYVPDVVWKDSNTLPEDTLKLAQEYQAPNGGMAFYIAQDQYVSPYLSAYTALAFNWLRDSGYQPPAKVENQLHDYLLLLLRKNVLPDYYSKGMAASVRAVALAALAPHNKIDYRDIRRYERHVKHMDLFGKAHYLMASLSFPRAKKISKHVMDMILAASNQTSGKISFNETLDDGYKRVLTSRLRTQCSALSALVKYDERLQDGVVSDLPFKLVRTITQTRKQRGHWENTQENMFCMNALREYGKVYEKVTPDMLVSSWMDETVLPITPALESGEDTAYFSHFTQPPVTFKHDFVADDVGRKTPVKIKREGEGRLYYTMRLRYATKEEKAMAFNSGIEVQREYHVERDGKWVLLQSPMALKTGELVRVDLYVSLPAARHFVVVDDPIPGGLEPVNRDLATASQVDADKAQGHYAGGSLWYKNTDWKEYDFSFWSFYHKELRHHAAIFYSDYLPPGNYHLSYTAQAIAAGDFAVMPTHAEEMYEPEVYGKGLPARLAVTRD